MIAYAIDRDGKKRKALDLAFRTTVNEKMINQSSLYEDNHPPAFILDPG